MTVLKGNVSIWKFWMRTYETGPFFPVAVILLLLFCALGFSTPSAQIAGAIGLVVCIAATAASYLHWRRGRPE